MKRRRHTPEQIVRKLAEADKLLAEATAIEKICRRLEITESTSHRWRNQYGDMKADDAKQLKDLDGENPRVSASSPIRRSRSSRSRRSTGEISELEPLPKGSHRARGTVRGPSEEPAGGRSAGPVLSRTFCSRFHQTAGSPFARGRGSSLIAGDAGG